ncbi:hypothetical protein GBF38_006834, partial [Nibea albiflora]
RLLSLVTFPAFPAPVLARHWLHSSSAFALGLKTSSCGTNTNTRLTALDSLANKLSYYQLRAAVHQEKKLEDIRGRNFSCI